MLPLRKHFVSSKSGMKPHSAAEGVGGGSVSALPTDQCREGEKWDLKAGQQVENNH